MCNSRVFSLAMGFALSLLFLSCSDDGGSKDSGGSLKKDKISGFSQKGPFAKGSAITLYELNDKLAQTGRSFEEMITDDKGSFEIKNVELESPYVIFVRIWHKW